MVAPSLADVDELVTPERLAAGRDYVEALERLHVAINAAMWGINDARQVELLLVSDLVDQVGPRTMYDALFKAYDLAKTPRSIDPWIVTVHSPNTQFAYYHRQSPIIGPHEIVERLADGSEKSMGMPWMRFGEWNVRADWMLLDLKNSKRDVFKALRGWKRFEEELRAA